MSEQIIDKNLERIIKVKMCVNGLNDIEQIEDICIQDINLMQKRLNIDLTEIVKMKNLKNISLKFFEITDEIIESINQLEFLEKIEFSMCIFKTKKVLSPKLREVIIYNSQNFYLEMLNNNTVLEELQLIHSGMVNITELNIFENLKYLKLSYCNVISIPKIALLGNLEQLYLTNLEIPYDIDITNIPNLKFISLNGSKVQNKEEYIQKLYEQNKNLTIEFREDDLPIE